MKNSLQKAFILVCITLCSCAPAIADDYSAAWDRHSGYGYERDYRGKTHYSEDDRWSYGDNRWPDRYERRNSRYEHRQDRREDSRDRRDDRRNNRHDQRDKYQTNSRDCTGWDYTFNRQCAPGTINRDCRNGCDGRMY
ncbi:MAG: hypothetical protein EHM86_09400 [Desulfobulbaceae bacterium]|nr:MAG: hypothetical protein EHM86_09400 [Desulfobulbaceae bacterium]